MRFVPQNIFTVKVNLKSRSFALLRMTGLLFLITCTIHPASQRLQVAGFGMNTVQAESQMLHCVQNDKLQQNSFFVEAIGNISCASFEHGPAEGVCSMQWSSMGD
jgi:hypothetical protein